MFINFDEVYKIKQGLWQIMNFHENRQMFRAMHMYVVDALCSFVLSFFCSNKCSFQTLLFSIFCFLLAKKPTTACKIPTCLKEMRHSIVKKHCIVSAALVSNQYPSTNQWPVWIGGDKSDRNQLMIQLFVVITFWFNSNNKLDKR